MTIIIQRVDIKNKGWAGLFRKLQIMVTLEDQELIIYSNEAINAVFDLPERVTIRVTKGINGYTGDHVIEPGTNRIDFDIGEYSGSIHIIHTTNIWKYLDEDIESPGMFLGRPYIFNKYTCETVFDDTTGIRLTHFPSFLVVQTDRCYYVDTDNKTVILEHPRIRRSKLKEKLRKLFKAKKRMPFSEVIDCLINRKDILQSGVLALMKNIRAITTKALSFSFDNEIGEDYGAVRREFFYIVFQEMLKDSRLVFSDGVYDIDDDNDCSKFPYDLQDNNFRYDVVEDIAENYPSVKSNEMFYTFLGVLFGCFLYFGETVNVRFSLSFYEAILKDIYTIRHIQDVIYQRHLLKYLRMNTDGFSVEDAQRMAIEKLYTKKINAYAYIKAGFQSVIPADMYIHEFTAFDFPFIFQMSGILTVESIKQHVVYEGCGPETQEIIWLWEILSRKDTAYLRCFLQFFTGSGNIELSNEECMLWLVYNRNMSSPFFAASSCAKRIEFGAYPSMERMEYYMDYSILNTEGFHKT
ncbi:E3 ubiquitin ligase SMURF1/2 [Pancytospora epiphaga]|nr:E3 ubiquitin ligase SMURF1/2 [Pancytospora epiphaga]